MRLKLKLLSYQLGFESSYLVIVAGSPCPMCTGLGQNITAKMRFLAFCRRRWRRCRLWWPPFCPDCVEIHCMARASSFSWAVCCLLGLSQRFRYRTCSRYGGLFPLRVACGSQSHGLFANHNSRQTVDSQLTELRPPKGESVFQEHGHFRRAPQQSLQQCVASCRMDQVRLRWQPWARSPRRLSASGTRTWPPWLPWRSPAWLILLELPRYHPKSLLLQDLGPLHKCTCLRQLWQPEAAWE